jgi:predicted ATPase
VLLRLPEDVADKLARTVAPRRRNQFLVDVVAQALTARQEENDRTLREAAERLNALEAQYPELAQEAQDWAQATLADSVDLADADFDRVAFEHDLAEARVARTAASAAREGLS